MRRIVLLFGLVAACRGRDNPSDAAPSPPSSDPTASSTAASAAPAPSPATSSASIAGAAADASPDAFEAEDEPAPFRREDWEIAIGKWTFEDNGEVWCECKATSSLLFWKKDRPRDFDVSVDVMFLGEESSAGILFRAKGEDFYQDATFYQFEWYTRGTHHDKRLSLMTKNPYWRQIVKEKFPEAPYGKWIRFRVRAEGDHIRSFIDDEEVFDKHDATFVRAGKIGLHVFQPRKVKFRRFRLKVLG